MSTLKPFSNFATFTSSATLYSTEGRDKSGLHGGEGRIILLLIVFCEILFYVIHIAVDIIVIL